MVARDLSNKRIQIAIGLASAISDPNFESVSAAEANALIQAAPAIRWDGLDFGMQASEQVDDRSLDDDATATLRGFIQFGGGVPFFMPKVLDTSSVLRQMFNLVKTRGTELVLIERIGWVDRKTAFAAGDNVNIYKVMTDGFTPDTEGTGGYAYIQSMLPRGLAAPWSIVRSASPTAVVITGGAVALAAGALALRRATYEGNDVTTRAVWSSSDETKAIVKDGIIEGIAAGTPNITAIIPGGLVSTAVVATVS